MFFFLYIYILGSALRDSAFLFARTFGRVSRKSSEEVFHICAKFNDHRSCSSRHKIIKLPYEQTRAFSEDFDHLEGKFSLCSKPSTHVFCMDSSDLSD